MTANYNQSLLRNLRVTLENALAEISRRLHAGEYKREVPMAGADPVLAAPKSKDAATQALGLTELAHQVAGSLKMVRCHAISRVADTLNEAVKGLGDADRRGWNMGRSQQIAQYAMRLADALAQQVVHMAEGNPVLPVSLWPLWAGLSEQMGQPKGTPEDLFEPDPQFNDASFVAVDAIYLSEVVQGATDRLSGHVKKWSTTTDSVDVDRTVRRILEMFDGIYGLKHRRSYQVYWLAWRARLTLGLLEGPAKLIENKDSWLRELEDAAVELRKFGAGAREPIPDRILETLTPILNNPWPDRWGVAHPVLAELDQSLNLSTFWRLAAAVQNPVEQKANSDFENNRAEILKAVRDFNTACVRAFDAGSAQAMRSLIQAGMGVLGKQEWIPDPRVMPLFTLVQDLVSQASAQNKGPPTPEATLETAGMLLTLEEVLQRPFPISNDLAERIEIQTARNKATWEGRLSSLRSLPVVRWDVAYAQQRGDQAVREALGVLHKDLVDIEEKWVEAERDELENPDDVVALAQKRLMLGRGVLLLTSRSAGAEVSSALLNCLATSPRFTRILPDVRARFVSGLAALSAYVEGVRMGESSAAKMLASVIDWAEGDLAGAIDQELNRDGSVSDRFGSIDHATPGFLHWEEDSEPEVADPTVVDVGRGSEASVRFESDRFDEASDAVGSREPDLVPFPAAQLPEAAPVVETSADDELELDWSDDELEGAAVVSPPAFVETPAPSRAAWLDLPLPPLPDDTEALRDAIQAEGVIDRPSDREFASSFVEEVFVVLENTADARRRLATHPGDDEAWGDLRRGYHTIKGSGRMVGYFAMAEVAWWAERALSDRIREGVPFDGQCETVLGDLDDLLYTWAEHLREHSRALIQTSDMEYRLDDLAEVPAPAVLPQEEGGLEEVGAVEDAEGVDTMDHLWSDEGDAVAPLLPAEPQESAVESDLVAVFEAAEASVGETLTHPAFEIEDEPVPLGPVDGVTETIEVARVEETLVQGEVEEGVEDDEDEADADWDEVFDALQHLIANAQRLGAALARVRNREADA